MPELAQALHFAAEAVKIVGGLASFYAVIKLRQIEKRYLFKATIPELIVKLNDSLSSLNSSLSAPGDQRARIMEALNYLTVDVRNVRRKCRGDSLQVCREMLGALVRTKPRRFFFWEQSIPMRLDRTMLLEIYGKGRGLVHSLENDIQDQGWSSK